MRKREKCAFFYVVEDSGWLECCSRNPALQRARLVFGQIIICTMKNFDLKIALPVSACFKLFRIFDWTPPPRAQELRFLSRYSGTKNPTSNYKFHLFVQDISILIFQSMKFSLFQYFHPNKNCKIFCTLRNVAISFRKCWDLFAPLLFEQIAFQTIVPV